MVGNSAMPIAEEPKESLAEALWRIHPELDAVREAATEPVYLVGGAVRDLLLGRGRADIDLVVEGDAAALAARLGAEVVSHERFATAKVELDGHEVDIASARSESYPHPGALPVVEPAATLEADLSRRDFSINAMAVPLDEPALVDPHGGQADLAECLLRVLHARSFVDDPTRALRAARYAARFGFELEPETERLLRDADLETVSADRRDADLLRLAGEREAARAFALLAEWGLVRLRGDGVDRVAAVLGLLESAPWSGLVPRDRVLLRAALVGPSGGEEALAQASPERPSEAVALASRHDPIELVLARAQGAEWLDRYLTEWRDIALEIDGEDLIAAGVAQGPAVGRGLKEALRRKLDGEIRGRDQELYVAVETARSGDGVA